MSSVEQLIISKIIETQSLKEASNSGIKAIHFAGDWEPVYLWITDYNLKHGAVPSERAFAAQYGDVDIVDTSAETFSGLFDELKKGYRQHVMLDAVAAAMQKMENDDVDSAMSILSKGLQSATTSTNRLVDLDMITSWEQRYAKYEWMRANPNSMRGIPTGFVGLDKITQGFRPQQFIVFAGEPKRGKSLMVLISALACHTHGLRPMFLSFEMSIEEQASRFDALSAHVPYDRILSGDLSDTEMARIHKSMTLRKNMQPFLFSEDASGLTTIGAISAKIQEEQPDLLVVDGMYLMDDENGEPKGSPQALTNISRGMKRLCQRFDIPIIGTTQVLSSKLQNKRTRAVTGDSLGYTSAWTQDTDLLLGVERNPDIDNQSIIRVVEARTAGRGEVHISWDWETMEFEEVFDYDPLDPSFD